MVLDKNIISRAFELYISNGSAASERIIAIFRMAAPVYKIGLCSLLLSANEHCDICGILAT